MDYLKQEDYEEPRCLLCETDPQSKEAHIIRIPVGRVIEKLDAYFAKNDTDGAKRHLLHWKKEAEEGGDDRGLFTVLNELVGLFRKAGDEAHALQTTDALLALSAKLGMETGISGATVFLNAGTVYKAFGQPEKALTFFEKARALYESLLPPTDARLAGLYNNMALVLVDLGRYDEAESLYETALDILHKQPTPSPDVAVSHLNLANLIEARDGLLDGNAAIMEQLDKAEAALNDPALPQDGYYAFVCEKCAPTFGYYGYFAAKADFAERARRIYAGT